MRKCEQLDAVFVALWNLPTTWIRKQEILYTMSLNESDPSNLDEINMLWGIANEYAYDEWKFIERS